MVAIHADDEGVDIMLLFQKLLQIVTKETFTSSGNTSDSDEWNSVAGHIQVSFGDFGCNFALLRLVDWRQHCLNVLSIVVSDAVIVISEADFQLKAVLLFIVYIVFGFEVAFFYVLFVELVEPMPMIM